MSVMDKVLFPVTRDNRDVFTLGNACEGVHIFGGTGSGKTSGSGRRLAQSFLKLGMGGLVLCAKPQEAEEWQRLIIKNKREKDIVMFGADYGQCFNFLDYENSRTGRGAGQTQNIVNIFNVAINNKANDKNDPFFTRAADQLLSSAVDLLKLAQEPITLKNITNIIASAPQQKEDVINADGQINQAFLNTYIGKLFAKIDARHQQNTLNEIDINDFELIQNYWLSELVNLSSRTRSSIISTFTGMANGLMRGVFYKLLNTKTTVTPEDSFKGKIIILDIPLKEWGETGRTVQMIFKYMWQQSIERRAVKPDTLPSFLWADEAQLFITEYDQEFLTTARSARASTVFLTQNYPNYVAKLGAGSEAVIDSMLGNFQTKIFHQNADPNTNEWGCKVIGQIFTYKPTINSGRSAGGANMGQDGASLSIQENLENQINSYDFTVLRKGGSDNGFLVDAVLFQGGRLWFGSAEALRDNTPRNFCFVTFQQIFV